MARKTENKFMNTTKEFFKTFGPVSLVSFLRQNMYSFQKLCSVIQTIWGRILRNPINLRKNKGKPQRYLEIGPGNKRLLGFETLNIIGGLNIDYVFNAAKTLPFEDNTFDLIYASHILEHIPWYKTEEVLKDWVRILKPGGEIEVWVPDGLKICETLLKAELEFINLTDRDGWYKFNPRKDPFLWASGRIFSYGDGSGNLKNPNWHRAILTPRYCKILFNNCGLIRIREMEPAEVRGYDHGWINFGIKGTKP
jgi:SAM-dependent methyltransferase